MSLENFDKLIENSVKNAHSLRFSDVDEYPILVEERSVLKNRYSHLLTPDASHFNESSLLFGNQKKPLDIKEKHHADGGLHSHFSDNDQKGPPLSIQPRRLYSFDSSCSNSLCENFN